jgi:hypothetical protein
VDGAYAEVVALLEEMGAEVPARRVELTGKDIAMQLTRA